MGEFKYDLARFIPFRDKQTLEEKRKLTMIVPVGPTPQYRIAAAMINGLRIPCRHVYTFNMDEYADENGHTAPLEWKGSFHAPCCRTSSI